MSWTTIGLGALAGGISGWKRDDRTVLGSTLAGGLAGMGRGYNAARIGGLLGGAYGMVGNMGIVTASGLGNLAGMGVMGARVVGKTFSGVRAAYPNDSLFRQIRSTGLNLRNDYNNWITGMVTQWKSAYEQQLGKFGNKSVSAFNTIQTTLKGGR